MGWHRSGASAQHRLNEQLVFDGTLLRQGIVLVGPRLSYGHLVNHRGVVQAPCLAFLGIEVRK